MKPKFVLLSVLCVFSLAAQSPEEADYRAKHWTDADKKEYRQCVVQVIKQDVEEISPDMWCELMEERLRWIRGHSSIAKRKWSPARFQRCSGSHEAEMNGSPEEWRAVFYRCMREGYGLVAPKQKSK